MDPLEPAAPSRRSMPVFAMLLLAALVALGLVFAWPW